MAVFSQVEYRLAKLGFKLPSPPSPMANYLSYRIDGNYIFLAGHGPLIDGVCPLDLQGRLGAELTIDDGYRAAQQTALNILSTLKAAAGDLDKVQIIRIQGFVACTNDFFDQPKVIDGASSLLCDVMGEAGKHSRVALGTNVLPFRTPVEIEVFAKII